MNCTATCLRALLTLRLIKPTFKKAPVICLSVSTSKVYHRTENEHPVLGVEYKQEDYSLTDEYFQKMGLKSSLFHAAA